MTEFTSTVTLTFEINNLEAFDKEEYIERLKEQYIELYDLEIKDHEISNIEEVQPLKCNPIESNQSIMTQTKVIGESVKRTERNFVKSYTDDYAKAITENYRQYHINTLQGNLSGNYPEYAREQLDAIENGTANLMWFKVYSGKRYYKIVQQEFETWEKSKYYGQYRDSSVHSFVDKETGEVYKPAGWAKPAKHVRFDMRDVKQLRFLLNPRNVDWAGGYLYLR